MKGKWRPNKGETVNGMKYCCLVVVGLILFTLFNVFQDLQRRRLTATLTFRNLLLKLMRERLHRSPLRVMRLAVNILTARLSQPYVPPMTQRLCNACKSAVSITAEADSSGSRPCSAC